MIIFDFQKDSDISSWRIVDDVVMGGRSSGNFEINPSGYGRFFGEVSLENNGGFSSVRYLFPKKTIEGFSKARIWLKGDGKKYQFRVKSSRRDSHSYIYQLETSGDWQMVEVPLKQMHPAFRGRKLVMNNYPAIEMEEIRFLIGNKEAEDFELLIDKIILE